MERQKDGMDSKSREQDVRITFGSLGERTGVITQKRHNDRRKKSTLGGETEKTTHGLAQLERNLSRQNFGGGRRGEKPFFQRRSLLLKKSANRLKTAKRRRGETLVTGSKGERPL